MSRRLHQQLNPSGDIAQAIRLPFLFEPKSRIQGITVRMPPMTFESVGAMLHRQHDAGAFIGDCTKAPGCKKVSQVSLVRFQ